MFAYHTLAIPEILENIFAFLNRKDLYRSCVRVNRKWNDVSTFVIRKKRTEDFIKIPEICNRVLNYLYDICENNYEFAYYCSANILWKIEFEHTVKTFKYYDIIKKYDFLLWDLLYQITIVKSIRKYFGKS